MICSCSELNSSRQQRHFGSSIQTISSRALSSFEQFLTRFSKYFSQVVDLSKSAIVLFSFQPCFCCAPGFCGLQEAPKHLCTPLLVPKGQNQEPENSSESQAFVITQDYQCYKNNHSKLYCQGFKHPSIVNLGILKCFSENLIIGHPV
jgi:hypothetical protein